MIHRLCLIILLAARFVTHAQEYVGTSPCGAFVREFLGISQTEPCDKITWRLNLVPQSNTFTLEVNYGLQEQSAPGFVSGGKTVTLQGELKTSGTLPKQIYSIKAGKSQRALSIARVNDNLLQLLDREGKSLVGNEFWSYTLNRKDAGKPR
jgi:hypothetical protein